MGKNKLVLTIIPVLILALVATTYWIDQKQNKKQSSALNKSEEQTISQTASSNNQKILLDEKDSSGTNQEKMLYVDPNRCRGCGRCATIDPEHFVLRLKTAEVISQNNLDSEKLTLAINSCPAGVIKLT